MRSSYIATVIAILAYLSGMIFIGIYFSRKNENVGDFYLGGRRLGPLVTAMSAEASDMSSWLLMGLPGLAYLSGLADPFFTAMGLALGTYVNWLLVSKRIRVYSHMLDAITLPEFFSKRYHDDKKLLTGISALIIVIFFIPYTASGFAACGKLLVAMFDFEYLPAMLISAVIIVAYTTLGGFMAASTTDFIQGIVMSLALAMVLIYGTLQAGGIQAVIENAEQIPGYLSLNRTFDPVSGGSEPYNVLSMLSMLAWGLGYFGMPHILLRFMAIEDKEKLKTSRRVATVWVVISLFIAVLIGIVANAMTAGGSLAVLEGSRSETAIVEIASLLRGEGPTAAFMAGIIVAGIIAATMSTSDSQLLAASSAVSQNLLAEFLHIKISEKAAIIFARITVIGISLLSVWIAADPESSVFEIVAFAWAGFGASFGPLVLTSLFGKHSNRYGAIYGMVGGFLMVFLWKFVVRPRVGFLDFYELLPAFLTALAINIIISRLTGGASKEVKNEFENFIRSIHA